MTSIPQNWIQISPGAFATMDRVVTVNDEHLRFLKQEALSTPLKRARLCAHSKSEDPLHEMLIVLARETHVRPHFHISKSESYHVVEGEAELVIFTECGKTDRIISLGGSRNGSVLFCRIPERICHCLVVKTDFFVVHETTRGPLDPSTTVFAEWEMEDRC